MGILELGSREQLGRHKETQGLGDICQGASNARKELLDPCSGPSPTSALPCCFLFLISGNHILTYSLDDLSCPPAIRHSNAIKS